MKSRHLAILAALGSTAIFGLSHTIAKEVMPHYVGGMGFIFFRIAGACILFWIASLFIKKERIDPKDYGKILLGSLFGMGLNMISFFKGLELSTPINSGVISTLTPLIVLVLSAIYLRERLNSRKYLGISIGLIGALILVASGGGYSSIYNAPNILLGDILLIIKALTSGMFLVIVTPLTRKYSSITLMKWMFLIGFFLTVPFTYGEFSEVVWSELGFRAIWRISFVVICTTFLVYLLNAFTLKLLSPTVLSSMGYLQPVIAILFALATGNDQLDVYRFIAFILVIFGVYLVSIRELTILATWGRALRN